MNLCEEAIISPGSNEAIKLKNLGYKIGTPLGSGMWGTAYDIGGKKVLKITGDEKEAKASSIIQKKPQKNVVRIHRVFAFKSIPSTYFIEQEKLKDSPFKTSNFDDIKFTLETLPGNKQYLADYFMDYSKGTENVSKESVVKHAVELVNDKQINKNSLSLLEFMFDATDQLKNIGIAFADWHAGNVMSTGSVLKVIDIGYSKSVGGRIEILEGEFFKLSEMIND